MMPVWAAFVLILVGAVLLRLGWEQSRGFEAQWTTKGLLNWVGVICIGLGVFVLLKAVLGRPTAWQTVYQSAGGFLLAYFIVGAFYKIAKRVVG